MNLRLVAINTTNVNRKERERERERERETIRKVPTHFKYSKYIENIARMHGKCMNM